MLKNQLPDYSEFLNSVYYIDYKKKKLCYTYKNKIK